MATGLKKAIIFARVSTKRQERDGLSLKEIQLPKAREYAKKNDISIIKEYIVGETGGDRKDRIKFDEMVEFLKKHEDVTEIISFRVDHITRNFRDAVTMDEMRQKYDKYIHCIDDRLILYKDSPARDLTQWNIKVFVAQEYLNRVVEDGNNTKYTKLERGELPWASPYGYEHMTISEHPKRKTVVSTEPQATIVRQIHIKFSSGSYSCKSLAEAINAEYSTNFHKGKINLILRDRFYIGIMTDKKTGQEYPHYYEKLVSDDLFEQNQAILDGHSGKRRRYAGIPSVYRGLIHCMVCGCTISPDPKTKRQKNGNIHRYFYYHCSNGKKVHDKLTNITENELNDGIRQILKTFHIPAERMAQLRNDLNETHASKNDFYASQRRELAIRRKQLSNRQQNTYDLLADKSITLEQYNENNARYAEELSEIQRREERLDKADQQFYVTAGYLLSIFEHAEKLFEAAQTDEKRQIIGLLLSNLQLDGKKFTFTLKEPFASVLSHANSSLWLGRQDSNLRMLGPKPSALPLGDVPSKPGHC